MARGEIYVELSVDYADDPKIIEAGEKAEVLYLRALCLAKRTLSDGHVADVQLPRFGLSGVKARARRLVEVGLWVEVEGGYQIAAYLKRNRPRAQVLADRSKDAQRKRKPPRNPDGIPPESGRKPGGLREPSLIPHPPSTTLHPPPTTPDTSPGPSRRPNGDRDDDDRGDRVEMACAVLAQRDLVDRQSQPALARVADVAGWLIEATARRLTDDGQRLTDLAGLDPHSTPEQLADALTAPAEAPALPGDHPSGVRPSLEVVPWWNDDHEATA